MGLADGLPAAIVIGVTHNKHSGDVPVLIVGGSLVGLSAAAFLARRGVEVLMVERHPGTAIHPRAGHLHLRTLELMRSIGLEERLQELSAERFFPNGAINEVHTLAGGEVASFIPDLNLGVEEFSPSRRLFVAQDALEPLLRERAETFGATLLYGTQVDAVAEDEDGVTATLRDLGTGEIRQVRSRYVVAADGNRSPVREHLGIRMGGHGALSTSITIYFRADCREQLAGTELGVVYVTNPRLRGFFRFERTGTAGFLVVNTLGDPREPGALDVPAGLGPDGAAELLRAAIGVADLPVQVDDVAEWTATADVAQRYGSRRILLAGDAAHVVPPNGGFGGNTGIHDAHNLAWKLQMVVDGHAGEDLLATYEAERRPVGALTVDQAFARYRHRVTPELLTPDVPALVDDFSMEIGYRYRSTAVVPDADAAEDAAVVGHPRDAGGRPGTRAPHLSFDGVASVLDLFGQGFVLLTGVAGHEWTAAAETVADRIGIPLTAHVVPVREFTERYGVTDDGAVLVRPDGFLAWRSTTAVPDRAAALEESLGSVLSRPARLALRT